MTIDMKKNGRGTLRTILFQNSSTPATILGVLFHISDVAPEMVHLVYRLQSKELVCDAVQTS